MKRKHVPILLLIGFILAGIYGCGGGGGGGDVTVGSGAGGAGGLALNAPSAVCAQCHAAEASSYALSLHNTQTAATCTQCHTGADLHAAAGGTVAVAVANPDATWGTLPAVVGSPRVNNGCTAAACHGPAGRKPLSLAHDNTAVAITGNTASSWAVANAQYVDMINNQPQRARCSGCHNAHDTTSRRSLFADYASSGHGDITGPAWIDDPWKRTGVPDASGNAGADQRSCQRCHLSTAFVAQINGTRTGALSGATLAASSVGKYSGSTSPSVVDVSSAVTTPTASNGNQVTADFRYYFTVVDVSGNNTRDNTAQILRCDACHSDNQYNMRAATAVTPIYKDSSTNVYRQVSGGVYNSDFEARLGAVDTSGNAKVIFPDVGKSNICINCHAGRSNGWAVQVDPGNFSNRSFMSPHYLVAAGILYRTIGYQYTDVSANLGGGAKYDNGTFRHKSIGVDPNYTGTTGTGGPCVGCHMYPARHKFSPVQKDGTGRIIGITSPTCGSPTSACHASATLAAEVNDQREQFESAMKAFEYQLQDPSGTYSTAATGFFYGTGSSPFKTTPALTTSVTNWVTPGGVAGTGKPNMGAAVNFKILKSDPGAYTHNRRYTKRLMWDSINWLSYNNLNTTNVGLAIDALTNARAAGLTPLPETDRANARSYLCGNTAVGAACPRP